MNLIHFILLVDEVDSNEPHSDGSRPHSQLGDSQAGDSPSLQTNGSGN